MEVGLYIHWPFCTKKCNYCDLNSHVRPNADYLDYVDAICSEINYWANLYPNLIIRTIFFGGGTPSLMKIEWIDQILKLTNKLWTCQLEEVTIEANPSVTECTDLALMRSIGIDRISFGVQSFNDRILRALGRTHTSKQALTLIGNAMNIFNNVSIDLMYGLPDQTVQDINDSLNYIDYLNLGHVSLYDLTIEENTNFGKLFKQNRLKLPTEEHVCDQYWSIVGHLNNLGMVHYEISNFALADSFCKHNMNYWTYKSFLGIGPGAHSRLLIDGTMYSIENIKMPEKWIQSIKVNGYGYVDQMALTPDVMIIEEVLMKLRIINGLSWSEATRLLRPDYNQRIDNLVATGDIVKSEDSFGLTSSGFLKYNRVLQYLALL